jgi:hypothetical protein
MQYNETGLEHWINTYRPIKNPISDTSGWDGTMFETHGEELDFVLKQHPQNVWTWWDVDHGSQIAAGYHIVNRIGYFITEKQWTEAMECYDVEMSEEDDI